MAVNEVGAGPPAEANITTLASKGTRAAESWGQTVFPGLPHSWQEDKYLDCEHVKKLYTGESIAHQRGTCSSALDVIRHHSMGVM